MQFKDRAGDKSGLVKATVTLLGRGGSRGGVSGEGGISTSRRTGEPPTETHVSNSEELSRLASEGVTGLPPEDLQIFFDAHDPDAHSRFLRWRDRNSRGYVISRRSASDAMLHRADCGHFEHGDKSASLTRTMKVCSRKKKELEEWARENIRVGLKRCRSCM